jgi:hypothetical protein
MQMNLKQYLKKFEQLLPYETRVRNAVIEVVQEMFQITLERKKIMINSHQVFIQGSSVLKSEIALKQKTILEKINKKDPNVTITKIA